MTDHRDAEGGRLADNILYFCRTLRRAGLPIGTSQVIDASRAVLEAGIECRDDFYVALRAALVTNPAEFRLFDQAFHLYFRDPRLLERMLQLLLPAIGAQADSDDGEAAARRLLEALADPREPAGANEVDVDRAETWSRRERLASKDFEQMSIDEHREALQLLQQGAREFRHVPTRRFRRNVRGRRPDLRRTLREVLRNNGEIAQLPRCARRLRPPTLVLICDISGSMSHYSRVFLQFAHTLCLRDQVVHSFLFGTRLTNISHRLADRDVDRAIAAISAEVRDWDGGTRIADSLQRFNHDWSRRVLAGRSVVVLLSDGLERDSGADLGFEMARLRRSCDLLVWLNPMLRYDEFAPLASGIRAMLPHVDRFQSAHNVASLLALGELVAGDGRGKLHAA